MTITKYWSSNQCTLTYKTDIKDYDEYWYNYTKDILNPYQFIVIENLIVPIETNDDEVITCLKDFCRLMTLENRVIIFDNEVFIRFLESLKDPEKYDKFIWQLDEIVSLSGFACIQAFDYKYNYKDVYIYTNSKLGMKVYYIIMDFYGYNEE